MKIETQYLGKNYWADLSKPLAISIPYQHDGGVRCFGVPQSVFSPVKEGDFVGSIEQGSPVNFYNVQFNPHGNGTHTECLGHISKDFQKINEQLQEFHFMARLISCELVEKENGNRVISEAELQKRWNPEFQEKVLIVRTLPNLENKLSQNYTETNPPYFSPSAMQWIVEQGIEHLLVDIPSVDKEKDEGMVACHKLFWQTESEKPRTHATITELIFVPNSIEDGLYFINLQLAPLALDAAPSQPTLYRLQAI